MTTELKQYQETISPLTVEANSLVIEQKEDLYRATDILSRLNRFNDNITEEKEKITKPLNQALKVERQRWKPLEAMYEEAITILKAKMSEYQTNTILAQKQKDDEIAKGLEDGTISLETAIAGTELTDKSVHTEQGSVAFVTTKKFRVQDLVILATEHGEQYILPNDTAIREAMKQGIFLAGVEYYEEQSIRNTR